MTKDEIILAQQARIEQLCNFIKHAQVSSGVCCCGDGMEGHPSPMACGHSPVDMWDYHSAQLLEAVPDDLSALRAHDAALENCRLFAARNRNEEWAKTILRFCGEAGIIGSPLRAGAIEKGGV